MADDLYLGEDATGYLPNVSIDFVIFGIREGELHFLGYQRKQNLESNYWALPGGWIADGMDMDQSAKVVLDDLTGVKNIMFEQFYTFGDVKRFPDARYITIAYMALINPENYDLKAGNVVHQVKWHKVSRIPKLAFDHRAILKKALDTLKHKVNYAPIGFELLPKKFTLTELHTMYEAILEKELDKRNFLKKILKKDFLVDLGEKQQGVAHRAAALYSFDLKKYKKLVKDGFVFDI